MIVSILRYSKVLNPAMVTSTNTEWVLALDTITLVNVQVNGNYTFVGLASIGGNIDGQVVTFALRTGNIAFGMTFANRSVLASVPANRFTHTSESGPVLGPSYGAITYRYDAAAALWMMIGRTHT